jgi:hypothetical protein
MSTMPSINMTNIYSSAISAGDAIRETAGSMIEKGLRAVQTINVKDLYPSAISAGGAMTQTAGRVMKEGLAAIQSINVTDIYSSMISHGAAIGKATGEIIEKGWGAVQSGGMDIHSFAISTADMIRQKASSVFEKFVGSPGTKAACDC